MDIGDYPFGCISILAHGQGIRHGADLKSGVALHPSDARLFCNLIRSYILFLIAEHERPTKVA
jgi:hypothetical protein